MKGAMAWPFLRLYILTLMFFSANAILNVFIPLRGHDLGATNTTIGIVMGATCQQWSFVPGQAKLLPVSDLSKYTVLFY